MAQTATPWTDAQCKARMEQLFKMAQDPSVDINEVMQDIGERAGSSFAVFCRLKEANSIKILQNRLANIEADRQETAAAANRTDKLGIKLENFYTQYPSYDPGYINFGGTAGR
jgi:S-formylglutathione hydrolase FrmB